MHVPMCVSEQASSPPVKGDLERWLVLALTSIPVTHLYLFHDHLRDGERCFFFSFSASICPSVLPNQIDYNNKTDKTLISMALQLAVALGQMEWVSTPVLQPLVNLNLC